MSESPIDLNFSLTINHPRKVRTYKNYWQGSLLTDDVLTWAVLDIQKNCRIKKLSFSGK